MSGAVGWLATPGAAFVAALVIVALLTIKKFHRQADGKLAQAKIAKVFLLSALAYTFLVLSLCEILLDGPSIATMVESGFGNGRVAYLMVGVALDQLVRVWDEFSHP